MSVTHPTAPRIRVELLEPILVEIVQVIGLDATMKFVLAHGGTRPYIAANPAPDSALSQLIGHDKACALGQHFADAGRAEAGCGCHIEVPRALRALRAARNWQIIEAQGQQSVTQLARRHGLTRRWVLRLHAAGKTLEGDEPDPLGTPTPQQRLF